MAARKPAGPMLRAVNKAIRGMHWLTEADEAAVAQARQYARLIDEAVGPVSARLPAGSAPI